MGHRIRTCVLVNTPPQDSDLVNFLMVVGFLIKRMSNIKNGGVTDACACTKGAYRCIGCMQIMVPQLICTTNLTNMSCGRRPAMATKGPTTNHFCPNLPPNLSPAGTGLLVHNEHIFHSQFDHFCFRFAAVSVFLAYGTSEREMSLFRNPTNRPISTTFISGILFLDFRFNYFRFQVDGFSRFSRLRCVG